MPSSTLSDPTRLESAGISDSIAQAIAPVIPAGPIAQGSLVAMDQARQGFQFGEQLGRLPVRNAAAQDAMERFKFEGALRPIQQAAIEQELADRAALAPLKRRALQQDLEDRAVLGPLQLEAAKSALEAAKTLPARRAAAFEDLSKMGSFIGKEKDLEDPEDPSFDLKATDPYEYTLRTQKPSVIGLAAIEAKRNYKFDASERKELQDHFDAKAGKINYDDLGEGVRRDLDEGGYLIGKGKGRTPIYVPPAAFTESDSQQINAVQNAKGDLERVKKEYAEYTKSNAANPVSTALDSLREMITGGSQASALNAAVEGLMPNLARGVFGEKGVLTDTDIARYRKTVPSSASPKAKTDALFDILEDKFNRQKTTIVQTMRSTNKAYKPVQRQLGVTDAELDNLPPQTEQKESPPLGVVPPPAPSMLPPAATAPPAAERLYSEEESQALAPGTLYRGRDGKLRLR